MESRDVLVAPGVAVHAEVTGLDRGPALVLLHGLGGSTATWEPVLEALAPRFRVVALDLRGHGRSSWPGVYSFERMRDDVLAAIAQLELDDVILLGHSMGGVVAYLVAQTGAAPVRRLVVEDVAPPFAWSRPVPQRPDGDLPFDWDLVPAIVAELDDPGRRWWPGLASITVPTLLIGGGETSHIAQDRLREVEALVPDCTMVTIPVGHDIHEAAPTRFVRTLLEWLDAHPDPGDAGRPLGA